MVKGYLVHIDRKSRISFLDYIQEPWKMHKKAGTGMGIDRAIRATLN
jgi:hypothetical protein